MWMFLVIVTTLLSLVCAERPFFDIRVGYVSLPSPDSGAQALLPPSRFDAPDISDLVTRIVVVHFERYDQWASMRENATTRKKYVEKFSRCTLIQKDINAPNGKPLTEDRRKLNLPLSVHLNLGAMFVKELLHDQPMSAMEFATEMKKFLRDVCYQGVHVELPYYSKMKSMDSTEYAKDMFIHDEPNSVVVFLDRLKDLAKFITQIPIQKMTRKLTLSKGITSEPEPIKGSEREVSLRVFEPDLLEEFYSKKENIYNELVKYTSFVATEGVGNLPKDEKEYANKMKTFQNDLYAPSLNYNVRENIGRIEKVLYGKSIVLIASTRVQRFKRLSALEPVLHIVDGTENKTEEFLLQPMPFALRIGTTLEEINIHYWSICQAETSAEAGDTLIDSLYKSVRIMNSKVYVFDSITERIALAKKLKLSGMGVDSFSNDDLFLLCVERLDSRVSSSPALWMKYIRDQYK
ncbi:hypothetical protein DdX_00982 [Ditylenchus destructor]|uniref:Uncharacterized protein n=1 Tax=Ditylenchus destructor TaxID=166010 RepID=A0AAD4R7Q9_9BILA|nr:hypothetical protein DdX_00982 [Ditylenchus destructor]